MADEQTWSVVDSIAIGYWLSESTRKINNP